MNRKEKFLEEIALHPIEKKVKVVKAMEKRSLLDLKYKGVSFVIDSIVKVLNETCGDNWDILFIKNCALEFDQSTWKREVPFSIEFVIHYPEILITNRDNESHLIRDLYIKLMPYTDLNNGFSFSNFRGKRMSVTKEEVMSYYQHSHMAGSKYVYIENEQDTFNWRGFCLGTSEINQVLTMLYSGYEEGKFKLLMLQLEEYLNYESIEGTPHKRINNVIGCGEPKKLSNKACHEYYKDLKLLRENNVIPKVNLDFKLRGNKVVIIDNDNLENYLKKFTNAGRYSLHLIAQKNNKGEYYGYRNIPETLPSNYILAIEDYPKVKFMFRGKEVNFKLIEEQEYKEEPFFISKQIKDYVKSEIEERIETKRFSSYIIEQLNTTTYLTRSAEQNRVSVPENQ